MKNLIRIVKMEFEPEKVETFLALFERQKNLIRAAQGCLRLELLQDQEKPNVFMTYSWWVSVEDLNQYRKSKLFQSTWALTKPLFNRAPEAWSLSQLHFLP
ncbi:MAG TPA: antibiotic biosynthesis monooxygenase family protein [Luteibaculaceae bacterium]|nr:antibiotic biosynthesis monooxygenase family protein [Luteibaculaceae bacterium]